MSEQTGQPEPKCRYCGEVERAHPVYGSFAVCDKFTPREQAAKPPMTGQKDHAALLANLQAIKQQWGHFNVGEWPSPEVGEVIDAALAALTSPVTGEAHCQTHGDPLVCLACEAEEDARPEWRKPCLTRRYSTDSPMRELPWRGCRVELSDTDQWCANCAAASVGGRVRGAIFFPAPAPITRELFDAVLAVKNRWERELLDVYGVLGIAPDVGYEGAAARVAERLKAAPITREAADHTCHDMNPPFPGPCAACERERAEYQIAQETAEKLSGKAIIRESVLAEVKAVILSALQQVKGGE